MSFSNIDGPGPKNRADRRAVAAIQRLQGSAGRKAAAQAKRMRKAAKNFERDLNRAIVFFALPSSGVHIEDPDGAYIKRGDRADLEGQYQIVVVGKMKARIAHYVKAVEAFLKTKVRLILDEPLPLPKGHESNREFRNIIVEVV